MADLTGEGTHVAALEGYDGKNLVMPGEPVRAGLPVGRWMKPAELPQPEPKSDADVISELKSEIAKMDGDGDGKVGGGRKKKAKKRP